MFSVCLFRVDAACLLFCMIFCCVFSPPCSFLGLLFLLRPVRFGFKRLRLRLVFFLVSCLPPSVPLCVVLFVAATLTRKGGPDPRRNPAGCSRPPLAQVARGSPSGQAGTATGHVKFRLTDTSVGHVQQGHFHSGPKKQPKHNVFGRDIPGTSGTQTSGYPGQKLYASGLFLLF